MAQDLSLLTPAELGRWHRLRGPWDRAAYAAAHVLARACTAELIGCAPDDVVLSQRCHHCGGGDHGRPQVQGRDDISVSLSHTLRPRSPGQSDTLSRRHPEPATP